MADLLVDTDVFVDHLRGYRSFRAGDDRIHYSVITRAELLAGRNTQEGAVSLLLAPFTEISVDRSIAESGGRLRRDRAIALPDALIAATALRDGLTLVTRNRTHFEAIPAITVSAPD